MQAAVIIQARTGSQRLPGKVLCDIEGASMLQHVVRRVQQSQAREVVVATSVAAGDNAIEQLCASKGWVCVRGSELDVLARFSDAAAACDSETIVRVTADCPLIDPEVINLVIAKLGEGFDYASNTLAPRTFPRGLDVEAFTRSGLLQAHEEAQSEAEREHVTPFFYQNPDRFRLGGVRLTEDLSAHRWTVDTPEDLALVRQIFAHSDGHPGGYRDILRLVEKHPDWMSLNAHVEQKKLTS